MRLKEEREWATEILERRERARSRARDALEAYDKASGGHDYADSKDPYYQTKFAGHLLADLMHLLSHQGGDPEEIIAFDRMYFEEKAIETKDAVEIVNRSAD